MSNFNNLSYTGGNISQISGAGRYGFTGVRPPYATNHGSVGGGGQSYGNKPRYQNLSRAQSTWNGWQCSQNQSVPQMSNSFRPMFTHNNYSPASWNNMTGQNQGSFQQHMTPTPTQLHLSKTTPSFQQQNQCQPPPNPNHVNLVKQCLNVPYWNGDNESGYNRGPITPLQPTNPEAFHQYFQQNQQAQLNPSKGVYVKVGAREEQPVVFANGGYPENEGQGDVHAAGRRNLG